MTTTDNDLHHDTDTMASSAGSRAKAMVDRGVRTAGDLAGRAHDLELRADRYVRDNTWWAVGIAAAAGVVAGLLLRGRKH